MKKGLLRKLQPFNTKICTAFNWVHKISDPIENELTDLSKSCNMLIIQQQLDESKDVFRLSMQFVYVKYTFKSSIKEDLLLWTSLKTNITGEQILKSLIII